MRVALALLIAAALPAAAYAATAGSERACDAPGNGSPPCYAAVEFAAGAGEPNDLRATFADGAFTLHDANVPVASTTCERRDERTVVCPGDALTILLGDGDDRVSLPDATGGSGRVTYVVAGPGADVVAGGAADEVINVGDTTGDDRSAGRPAPPAPDTVMGGGGFDRVDYDESRPVEVDLATGAGGGAAAGDRLVDVEGVYGGRGPSSIAGDEQANHLLGGDGANRLAGRGGDDRLEGGLGDDVLDGGDGDDRLYDPGRRGRNVVLGGAGGDRIDIFGGGLVRGGAGDDVIAVTPEVHDGALRVRCGAGEDVAQAAAGVSIAADCEWLDLGLATGQVTVRRALRLRDRTLTVRLRGWAGYGRLTLRERRSGRRLASAAVPRRRGARIVRLRLTAAAARRARRVPVTLELSRQRRAAVDVLEA